MGDFQEIQTINRTETSGYDPGIYSFVRWSNEQKLIVVANFSWLTTSNFELKIPEDVIQKWNLKDGTYSLKEQLYGKHNAKLEVINGKGHVNLSIAPSESFVLEVK